MPRVRRDSCLSFVFVLALSVMSLRAGAAEAPKADADAGAAAQPLEELVITGSRITSAGFTQPTPTTMLSAPDIEKVAEPNLFDAIASLPALQGSTGRTTF